MKVWLTAMAVGTLLGGCAPRNRVSRVTVPANSLQPIMQRQILNAVDAGEGNPRVRTLRERMAADPKNVRIRLELAEEYSKSGYPELELEHLRLAVERFPESEIAVLGLCRALVRGKRSPEAAALLNEFVPKQDKPSASVLSWAGIVQDELSQWKDGELLHRRALERAPGRDWLHNNLGYNLTMQGRNREAMEEFRRALDLNPGSETARNNLGMTLADQPAAAIAQLSQTSDLAVAHNNLATYLYEKGDLAGARKELELALEYRMNAPLILENLRKLASLDGLPIQMPQQDHHSFWKIFARGMKQTFIAGDEKHSSAAAEAGR